jgi:hypothetical protein
MAEGRRQMAEVRSQKSEDRGQRTKVKPQLLVIGYWFKRDDLLFFKAMMVSLWKV